MVFLRAFAVWLVVMAVESIHGIFRRLVLEPWVGDFPARQISVFTGSLLILIVTYLFIDWIRPTTRKQLTVTGVMWVLLTLSFEIGVGRFAFAYSWERVLSDFNIAKGGLLGIGVLIMGYAPRITASLRRVRAASLECTRSLPGDDFIPNPIGSLTHAITVNSSRESLWPWLVQMGGGRGGWYSYDFRIIAATTAPTASFLNSRRSPWVRCSPQCPALPMDSSCCPTNQRGSWCLEGSRRMVRTR